MRALSAVLINRFGIRMASNGGKFAAAVDKIFEIQALPEA